MSPPLLIGTDAPHAFRLGVRPTCLDRDAECVVTSWTYVPIPWPRVQPSGQRGGSGLLVDEMLLRAVRTELVKAIMYRFGVGHSCVRHGHGTSVVTQIGTEGGGLTRRPSR